VKIAAMKSAKEKADYLLTAIGEKTGKPLLIREQVYTAYPLSGNMSNTAMQEVVVTGYGMARAAGLENEISFTKIKLRYEIFAKFGIL
jgi:hypothetical protein